MLELHRVLTLMVCLLLDCLALQFGDVLIVQVIEAKGLKAADYFTGTR